MNIQELLNTIRDNASTTYQDRIPEATRTNLESIRYAMIDDDNIMVANEFMSTLLNKLVKSVVHTKIFNNPLKGLKKGTKPLGDTVEEIYNNFLKGVSYDATGSNLLNRSLPDTKTVYHRMNYKLQYSVTINRDSLSRAFISYNALESYITGLINSLYNSAELDEYANMKEVLKSALDSNAVKKILVVDPIDSETNGKKFIKAVKKVSDLMTFPSSEYNGYLSVQDSDTKPIVTFTRKDEQILFIDADTNVNVNIDVLASIFNMSVAEFNDMKKIVLDTFPNSSVRAMIVDEAFFQIYDDLFNVTEFYNPKGLYTNYYLNVWQTQAYSPLVNAVAFIGSTDEDNSGAISTYTVTNTLKAGVTTSNSKESVVEGKSYTATLTGVAGGDTVTVTMGGTDVTATAYTSATNKITISKVTGNLVITVA